MRIYFDNASTTPLLPEVVDVMHQTMVEHYGNPSSIHNYGRTAKSIIESARKQVANNLQASIGEIFFTSGATEANNTILKNVVQDHGIKFIFYNPTEHHCVLHTIQFLATKGIETIPLAIDDSGEIQYNMLEELLKKYQDHNTLTTIMHANNEIGTINDIKRIGDLCYDYGSIFHSDTVQTIGKYPIKVDGIHLDYATASAHKFFGPKGIGFMYIKNEKVIKPYLLGGAQERNMRAGTENIYGITGMAKALEMAEVEMEKRHTYVLGLKNYFKDRLTDELYDVRINGQENGLYHILSASFPDSPKAEMLMFNLDISGIAASSASACSSGIEVDSHVLNAIGHQPDRKTIRFSFSHFNTKSEIDFTMEKLKTLTKVNQHA